MASERTAVTSRAPSRRTVSLRNVLQVIVVTGLVFSSLAVHPSTAAESGREEGGGGGGGRPPRASPSRRGGRGGGRARRRWAEGDVRLVGGPNRTAGVVLLYHGGKWGAVCDDTWGVSSSDVVCRQQGFPGSARLAEKKEFGGRPKWRIWIIDVQCQGQEQRLLDCGYQGWGYKVRRLCPGQWRAAQVVCRPKRKTRRTPAQRRAWRLRNWRKYLARRKARRKAKAAAKKRKMMKMKKKKEQEEEEKLRRRKPKPVKPGKNNLNHNNHTPKPAPENGRGVAPAGRRGDKVVGIGGKDAVREDLQSNRLPEDGGAKLEGGASEENVVLVPWAIVEKESDLRREPGAHHGRHQHHQQQSSTRTTTEPTTSTPTTTTTTPPHTTTTITTSTLTTTTTTPTTTSSTTTTTPTTTTTESTTTTTTSTTTTTASTTTTTIPTTTTTPTTTTATTTMTDTTATSEASSSSTASSTTSSTIPASSPTSTTVFTTTSTAQISTEDVSEASITPSQTDSTTAAEAEDSALDLTKAKADGEITLKGKSLASESALLLQADSPSDPELEVKVARGRYPWEGLLEVREKTLPDPGPWGTICGDLWGMRETMVVCRQLGLNHAKQPLKTNYFGGHDHPKLFYSFNCTGRETALSDCTRVKMTDQTSCPKKTSVAGIVCSTYLPDLIPNLRALSDSVRLQDRPLYYLQCALEENCLASSAHTVRNTSKAWRNNMRRLLRFSTIVHNRGDEDFRPYVAKGQWQWHSCHMHYHSMEVFAHYDIMDENGTRLAEGSKASFCLEDTTCDRGVSRKFQCAGFGDQGLSVNCSDNYMWDIDCQWIDITDIKPGTYTFLLEVNPTMLVAENNFDNNVARCDLWYSGYFAKFTNCRHESLLDYWR